MGNIIPNDMEAKDAPVANKTKSGNSVIVLNCLIVMVEGRAEMDGRDGGRGWRRTGSFFVWLKTLLL